MATKKRAMFGILAIVLLLVIFIPGDSDLGYAVRTWFQPDPPDPEYITVTTTQISPPITTKITEHVTKTVKNTVTIVPGVSSGFVEISGRVSFYDSLGVKVREQTFWSGKDPGDVGLTELENFRVRVDTITIKGQNLDPESLKVNFWIKLDKLTESKTLWKTPYSLRADKFDIEGDKWVFTATGTELVDHNLDLVDIAAVENIPYKQDGTKWNFRIKAKLAIKTPKGTELIAYAQKSFVLETDWCSGCGGVLVFNQATPISSTSDIIWTGGKVGLFSVFSANVGGIPIWVAALVVGVLTYRYYRTRE